MVSVVYFATILCSKCHYFSHLQIGKLRLREAEESFHSLIASKWWGWDLNPDLAAKVPVLTCYTILTHCSACCSMSAESWQQSMCIVRKSFRAKVQRPGSDSEEPRYI